MSKSLYGLATALFLFVGTPIAHADNIFNRAFSYIGLHEKRHTGQVQSITKVNPARTPWCAAFVNGVLKQSGKKGSGSNLARSFTKYGSPTKSPQKGDIVVLRSHVGFFHSFTRNGKVAVLGGNQSNMVKISHYSTRQVISYRKV